VTDNPADQPIERFAVWYVLPPVPGLRELPRHLVATFPSREDAEIYVRGRAHLLIEDILATALGATRQAGETDPAGPSSK
jgi:hypothetical protein